MRLLAAEALKLRTAPRTPLVLVLGLTAIVGLGSAAAADSAGDGAPEGFDVVRSPLAWDLLDIATTSTAFALIFGILVLTWEYRHGTVTPTFLVTPRRERVVAAKLVVAAAAGVALAVIALGVAFALGKLWVGELGVGTEELKVAGRVIVAGALWSVVGIGFGGALRSQVGAIVAAFVWFLVAEPLIASQLESGAEYFPGSALDRFVGTGDLRATQGLGDEAELGLGAATALVCLYAAAAAVVAAAIVRERDVA